MIKMAMLATMGAMNGLPLTNAHFITATAECLSCQPQRPTLSPQHGSIPRSYKLRPGGMLIMLVHFHHGRASLCRYWQRFLFQVWNCFSYNVIPLPKLPSVDFHSAFSTALLFHRLFLTKEHILQLKKWGNDHVLMEHTGLTMLLAIQKQLDW